MLNISIINHLVKLECNSLELNMSSKEVLVNKIREIESVTNEQWITNLEDRKLKELEFHNKDRDPEFVELARKDQDTFEKFYGNKKYYKTTKLSVDYIDQWIKNNSEGKICLDYACGNGIYAFKMAESNPDLVLGLDISDVSINFLGTPSGFVASKIIFPL